MNILVTGSSGRIGSRLITEIVDKGNKVTAFDIKSIPISNHDVLFVEGSIEDKNAVRKAVKDVDIVIHLSALMSWNDSDADRLFNTNVIGTFNILESIDKKKIKKFIFISSGEVYPEGNPEYLPIDEHHPTRPLNYYGTTKLIGEKMVWFYARKFGMPAVVLRISHTQDASELLNSQSFFSGPRFFLQAKIARAKELGKEEELAILEPLDNGKDKLVISRGADGKPYMMPIAETRDIIQGIVLSLNSSKAAGEVFNIGPDESISFDKGIVLMHELTGLPIVEANLPGKAVHYVTSISKAREMLGFRPEWDFKKMLKEAVISWNNKNKSVKGDD